MSDINYEYAHGVACVELVKAEAEIERLRTETQVQGREQDELLREIERLRAIATDYDGVRLEAEVARLHAKLANQCGGMRAEIAKLLAEAEERADDIAAHGQQVLALQAEIERLTAVLLTGLSPNDLCRLSRAFNEVARLDDSQDYRINEWLKTKIAAAADPRVIARAALERK